MAALHRYKYNGTAVASHLTKRGMGEGGGGQANVDGAQARSTRGALSAASGLSDVQAEIKDASGWSRKEVRIHDRVVGFSVIAAVGLTAFVPTCAFVKLERWWPVKPCFRSVDAI